MNTNRIKEFISLVVLEIYETENKIISIGLKWGDSKYLTQIGFKRQEQIRILNHLETLDKEQLRNFGVMI